MAADSTSHLEHERIENALAKLRAHHLGSPVRLWLRSHPKTANVVANGLLFLAVIAAGSAIIVPSRVPGLWLFLGALVVGFPVGMAAAAGLLSASLWVHQVREQVQAEEQAFRGGPLRRADMDLLLSEPEARELLAAAERFKPIGEVLVRWLKPGMPLGDRELRLVRGAVSAFTQSEIDERQGADRRAAQAVLRQSRFGAESQQQRLDQVVAVPAEALANQRRTRL